jgi:hypothetical protein
VDPNPQHCPELGRMHVIGKRQKIKLKPEEKVAEAGQEKEKETEDDLGAGEEDQEDEEEPAPEEDLLVDNVDGEDAHACSTMHNKNLSIPLLPH